MHEIHLLFFRFLHQITQSPVDYVVEGATNLIRQT